MSTTRTGSVLFGLALFATLLNACKPLTTDDSVYYLFARHIADHPDDPYGFRVWDVQGANSMLAPPVLLYWWALVLRLGGTDPLAWKLSLLPFCLLLVVCLYALGRRFAPGSALLFTACVSLSPVVLPCWNLMLDLPALALLLLGVLIFLRATATPAARAAFASVFLAGAIGALAAQTKYTGLLAGGIFVLAGWWYGRPAWGLAALGVLVALFVGWETWIAWRYGDSHFYLGALQFRVPLIKKLVLVQPLFGYLGSTAVALLPLTLTALGCSRRVVFGTIVAVSLWFALVLLLPWDAGVPSPGLCGSIFGLLGVALVACVVLVGRRLVRGAGRDRDDGFLILWLLLEVAGYFALTPHAATRRIVGVTVVGTLLVCRLLGRTEVARGRLVSLGFDVVLALVLFSVDCCQYHGERVVAEASARQCREVAPTATIWCRAWGASEFYAVRAGMKWLDVAQVRPGDRVVVFPSGEADFQAGGLAARCAPCGEVSWRSPLGATSAYQAGNLALSRNDRLEVTAHVWRVK